MMIIKKQIKRIGMMLTGMLLLAILVPQNVCAIDRLDSERDVSLTIEYQGAENSVAGAEFKLYKVADVSGFGEFELTGDFADYPVRVNDLDTAGWKKLAETLAIYVTKDQIKENDSGITNEEGVVYFPTAQTSMGTGLYLVIGDTYIYEHQIYTPEPTLICLPNRDTNDEWIYDVVIKPKYTVEIETTTLQVIKIWEDNKNEKVRPTEIEVQLLKDGEVYDTEKLNKDNNWRYAWDELEAGYKWEVVEKKVPDGYTVTIDRDQTIYTITNTYKTTTPDTPSKLPQTGVLWWPVPILAGAGMLFFVIGWIRRRRSGE